MENEFYLFLNYKGKKVKFRVLHPNDSLGVLMDKLKSLGIFELKSTDTSGAPVNYYFSKTDASGKEIILYPRVGKKDYFLHDFNIMSGDSLTIVLEPIAG